MHTGNLIGKIDTVNFFGRVEFNRIIGNSAYFQIYNQAYRLRLDSPYKTNKFDTIHYDKGKLSILSMPSFNEFTKQNLSKQFPDHFDSRNTKLSTIQLKTTEKNLRLFVILNLSAAKEKFLLDLISKKKKK